MFAWLLVRSRISTDGGALIAALPLEVVHLVLQTCTSLHPTYLDTFPFYLLSGEFTGPRRLCC
jgi:hypothetical protein